MVLVNYSDTDSDSDTTTTKPKHANKSSPTCQQPTVVPRKRKANDDDTGLDNTTANPVKIKSAKPPPSLPTSFHTLYSTNVRTSTTDDPDLHGGRKRQITHVIGNWPSHIYLECTCYPRLHKLTTNAYSHSITPLIDCITAHLTPQPQADALVVGLPTKDQLTKLDDLISRVGALLSSTHRDSKSNPDPDPDPDPNRTATPTLTSFLRSPLSAQLPLHISLSAPLMLNTSNKDTFRDRLHRVIRSAQLGKLALRPGEVDLVPNFERSRWFLILRVVEAAGGERKGGGLRGLLDVCNGVCGEFGLPLLYSRVGSGSGRADMGIGIGVDKRDETGGLARGDDPIDDGIERGVLELHGGDEGAFHVSIAWTLEGASDEVTRAIRGINVGGLARQEIEFDRVKVKIGNVVDDVLL